MSDNRDTGTEPLGLARAASLLGNFNESGLAQRGEAEEDAAPAPEADEPNRLLTEADDDAEAQDDGEQPDEDAEPDEGEEEPGEEDEPEETDEESEQQDATLDDDTEVDVDGSPVKLSELRSGYLRQSDYTRKTQALAEERKSLDQNKAEAERLRSSYTENLQVLDSFLQKSVPYDDAALDKLAEEDPAKYTQAERANRKHLEALNVIRGELRSAHEARAKEFAEARRKAAEEGMARLPEVIPEWRNSEIRKREAGEVAQYLKSLGRSDEEIAGITDPVIVSVLRKAMLHDKGQQAKQTVAKKKAKPKPAPAPSKVQKPGAAKEPGHQKAQELTKLRKSLKAPGSRNEKFDRAARYMKARGL